MKGSLIMQSICNSLLQGRWLSMFVTLRKGCRMKKRWWSGSAGIISPDCRSLPKTMIRTSPVSSTLIDSNFIWVKAAAITPHKKVSLEIPLVTTHSQTRDQFLTRDQYHQRRQSNKINSQTICKFFRASRGDLFLNDAWKKEEFFLYNNNNTRFFLFTSFFLFFFFFWVF